MFLSRLRAWGLRAGVFGSMRLVEGALRGAAVKPVLVIWGFGYLLVDITVTAMGRMGPGVSSLASLPLFALAVTYTLLLEALRRRLAPRARWLRWGGLGAGVVLATLVHSFFDLYYFKWLAEAFVPGWQRWAADVTPERLFTVGLLYLWTFCLALTLLWAAGIGLAAESARAEANLHEAAKQRAEAAALRLQLNPHFLFNTLNSISSLVMVDRRAEAEEMIERLAGFLRASLESDPMADVPLARELEMIDAYLGIESARFGDRLDTEISADPGIGDEMVPNFILQPLVENALKHGVAQQRGQVRIAIRAERADGELRLSVDNRTSGSPADARDSAPSAADPRDRTGIGLANVRQRLALGYGERAQLETGAIENGYRAVIRIPRA